MANRSLIVEIVGDASSLEREFKRATAAAGKFSGTVKEQAAGAITAQVSQQHELQKLAAEYKLVARNAKQGSEVQITAARLAANAERQLAASFGLVNAESRRSAHGFTLLHGEVGKASRGALAGSGVFRGLGRSIAFASGGFLAFATIGDFLRKSIDAAKEAQVTQKQLGAQFRASGTDLSVYQAAIDKTANRLSLLAGFENDELKAGFTTIFRTTNNVSRALRDLGTAADLARAKHLGFAQASLIIAKTEAGNTTLLRRQGFEIKKNATAEEALAVVRAKVAGQAQAGTTAQERFGAVLHNTEEIIGTALLPTLNKYLTSLAKWLTKMNESGKLERDVHQATRALASAISAISILVHGAAGAFGVFAGAVGGAKKAIELLAAAFVVLKAKAALTNAGGISGGLRGVGTAAEGSSKKVGLLGSALTNLPETIAITLAITELITQKQKDKAIGDVNKKLGGFAFGPGEKARDGEIRTEGGHKFVVETIGGQQFLVPLPQKNPLKGQRFSPFTASTPTVPKSVSGGVQIGLTPAQQQQITLAGNPDDLKALRAQAAFDQKQIDRLRKRFAEHKTGTKAFTKAITAFLSDQNQTTDHINSIVKAAADAAKSKAKARADKLNQLFDSGISSALDRVQDLGVGKQVSALKQIAGQIQTRIAATKDVLRKRELEDQLLGIIRQEKAARQQVAQNLIDSLQLNVDKASVTAGLADDLSALTAEQKAIQARMKSEGKTLELQRDMFDIQQRITDTRKQHADDVFAGLSLRVDKAGATKSAVDDLAALAAEQQFIQARIKSEGKTLDLQQSLFDVRQKIVAAREQQRQNRTDTRNAKQFKALGLTATGEDIVPGAGALKKQLKGLDAGIAGSFLDTKKTRSLVSHLKQVLSGGLGEVGRTVRAKVQQMLNDLDSQLKGHEGDVTKFRHVSTAKLLGGLGLNPEQLRIARLRLSTVGQGGTVPAGRQLAFAPTTTPVVKQAAVKPVAAVRTPVVKTAPITRNPVAKPVTVTVKPTVKPVVVKPPVVKPAPVIRKPAVGPTPVRKPLAAAAPVARKPIVKPVTVTVKVVVKPVVVIRKPVVKPVAAVLHRVPRPLPAPTVPVTAVRIPRVRHPVAAAATQRDRQATATSPSAVYNIQNLHINRPVGDPRQLEDQLQKRTRSRANVRRGA